MNFKFKDLKVSPNEEVDENLPSQILSDITVYLKYSKFLPEKKRRETWDELVDRNMEMHIRKYPMLRDEIVEVYEKFVRTKKVLASMRSFQFAGKAIEITPTRIYNCACGSPDDPYFYAEAMFLLLGGSGLGYLVTKDVVDKLPAIHRPIKSKYKKRYVVGDSIEGWSSSVEMLVNSYFYEGKKEVEFDFSSIRPKGARLVTAGGHAPGPAPLQEALIRIKQVFEDAIADRGEGTKLKPIEVHDQFCFIADAVLSGGIRRCLPKGTEVFTTQGLVSIENIEIGDEVYTNSGVEKVSNKFIQGTQKISHISTDVGIFKATKNHRMAVLGKLGGYNWKTVEELTPEDQLVFFDSLVAGKKTQLPADFTAVRPKGSTTCANIVIPELDEDMAWFLGFFHGNGHVYNRVTKRSFTKGGSSVITVTTDTKNIGFIERAEKQILRFGITPRVLKRPNENTNEVLASSQRLVEYFERYIKVSNTTIRIPDWIKQATFSIRSAYLAGVIDSDGCILNRPIKAVTTVYPEFAEDIKNMYASLGIPTKIKTVPRKEENWKTLYEVALIGFRERYNSFIGDFSLKGLLSVNKPAKGYSVPKSLVDSVLRYKDYRTVWDGKDAMNYERACTFPNVESLIPGVPINIVSVQHEVEEMETYDIEVENVHEFYANGFLSHNSAMIVGFSPDDEEMITCKSGNWWEQNPQRARANNSVVLVREETSKEQFDHLWEKVKASNAGEPGFYWTNDKNNEYFTNPCCLSGNTLLPTKVGLIAVRDLASLGKEALLLNVAGDECEAEVWSTGIKKVYSLILNTGNVLTTTGDHRFMLKNGDEEVALNLLGKELKTVSGKLVFVKEILEKGEQEVFDFSLHGGLPWSYTIDGIIIHNCEISLRADGGFCNLTEINASNIESQEDFNARAKAGAFLGTLQAGFTNFHFLRERWRKNAEEEALLGVSMTGIASMKVFNLDMEQASKGMIEENRRVASIIGINPAKRIGAVKPSGTTSLVLGSSSGVHAYHDQYYIRRIRVDKNESIYGYLSVFHPELVEDEFFAPHKTAVISIPQKAPEGAVLRTESPFDLLNRVKILADKWIRSSHIEGVNTHNVSVTVSLKEEDWKPVGEWMWENREVYNGISVLPFSGSNYPQMPFSSCTKEEYEEKVKSLFNIDLSFIEEEEDNTTPQGEVACSGGTSCEVV